MQKKGLLVAIEGIDGSGKSSLIHEIARIIGDGVELFLTKEPGDTELGRDLRVLLHEKKENVCDKAEFLLFAADRAQHFREKIIPALATQVSEEQKIVISDRLHYSSLAYQGYGRGLEKKIIEQVNSWAMNGIEPDLVFYIKLDFKTALERIMLRGGKLTSFETEKELFWKRVCDGFETIFQDLKNVVVLDGKKSIEELGRQASEKIIEKAKRAHESLD